VRGFFYRRHVEIAGVRLMVLLIARLITVPSIACALGEKADKRLYHAVFGIQSKRGVIRVFRDEELRAGHSAQLSLDDAGGEVGTPTQPRLHRLHDHHRTSDAAERTEAVCADDRGPLSLDGSLQRSLAIDAVGKRRQSKAHPAVQKTLGIIAVASTTRAPCGKIAVDTGNRLSEPSGKRCRLRRGILGEGAVSNHSVKEDQSPDLCFRGDERGHRAASGMSEENGAAQIQHSNQLTYVFDMTLQVVASRRLVAEPVSAKIHTDQPDTGSQPLRQRREVVLAGALLIAAQVLGPRCGLASEPREPEQRTDLQTVLEVGSIAMAQGTVLGGRAAAASSRRRSGRRALLRLLRRTGEALPYSVVIIRTTRGDLITRPENVEVAVRFSPLAVRYGDRYCHVDSGSCYGVFPEVCEFTDFRYGPYLAEFFPTCKPNEPESTITVDGFATPSK
jgi:hypothetical protein